MSTKIYKIAKQISYKYFNKVAGLDGHDPNDFDSGDPWGDQYGYTIPGIRSISFYHDKNDKKPFYSTSYSEDDFYKSLIGENGNYNPLLVDCSENLCLKLFETTFSDLEPISKSEGSLQVGLIDDLEDTLHCFLKNKSNSRAYKETLMFLEQLLSVCKNNPESYYFIDNY